MATITESFNKADADTLGPDQTWTEDQGDVDVVSNRAQVMGSTMGARVTGTSLCSGNHYTQYVLPNACDGGRFTGPTARHSHNACGITAYAANFWQSGEWRTRKWINGVISDIGTSTNCVTRTNCDILQVEANGSTIRRLRGAGGGCPTEQDSTTDSCIAACCNTTIGMLAQAVCMQLDCLTAADLAGCCPSTRRYGLTTRGVG